MRLKSRIFLLFAITSLAGILCGCGVSDEERTKLYDAVLETGDLNLSVGANEYEDIEQVDGSPVPSNTTYYIYKGTDGAKYRFDFKSTGSKEQPYRVNVTVDYDFEQNQNNVADDAVIPRKSVSYQYTFKKSKLFNKMQLIDSGITLYQYRYKESDRAVKCGIGSLSIHNGELAIYFDVNYVDEKITKYISDYKEGITTKLDVKVGTDSGVSEIGDVVMMSNSGNTIDVFKAKISIDGEPKWISIGDVTIEL